MSTVGNTVTDILESYKLINTESSDYNDTIQPPTSNSIIIRKKRRSNH